MPIFPDIFSPSLDKPSIGCLDPRQVRCDSSHNIYPIDFLNVLLEKIKKNSGVDDNRHTIRFLVDIYGRLWFAEEGGPGKIIPAHYQITGEPANSARCITAGNITFSANHKEIIAINHKSGDFKPPFDTLKWVLAILVANEHRLEAAFVSLAATINIQKLSSSLGSDGEPTYAIEKAELETAIENIFDIDELRIQPTVMQETIYNKKRRRDTDDVEPFTPLNWGCAASSNRLLFDDAEPASPTRFHAAAGRLLESPKKVNAAVAEVLISSPPRRPRGAGSGFFGAGLLMESFPLATSPAKAPALPAALVDEEHAAPASLV